MQEIMANLEMARSDWHYHQRRAWALFGFLVLFVIVIAGFALRLMKPTALLWLLFFGSILQIVLFWHATKIIKLLGQCEEFPETMRLRIQPIMDDLLPKTGLRYKPQIYVSGMPVPNAFAFGSGWRGDYGIAVTKTLLELLTDEELKAVLAHECGHLRAKDTVLMTLVSITITMVDKIGRRFAQIGRAALLFSIALEVCLYLPRILAAGVSQLRELAADAFAVSVTGSTEPLKRAFDKFEIWFQAHPQPAQWLFHATLDELTMSHPDMTTRKAFLSEMNKKELS